MKVDETVLNRKLHDSGKNRCSDQGLGPNEVSQKYLPIGLIALVLFGLAISVVGSEIAAQVYAYYIVKQGKLFMPDEKLGWLTIPDLAIERNNADGLPWRIETSNVSIRGASSFPDDPKRRRVLVLGDSMAFGEGVDLTDRFDIRINEVLTQLAFVNIAVPGYGTDQQVIRARDHLAALREGDSVLILFHGNDFMDVARKHHSGRSKPWFEMSEGRLLEHAPHIGFMELLRDKSYLASILSRLLDHDDNYETRLLHSDELVLEILNSFSHVLRKRGIKFWLAYNAVDKIDLPFDANEAMVPICRLAQLCIDLDPVLTGQTGAFLTDGHWSSKGHSLVGDYLAAHLM